MTKEKKEKPFYKKWWFILIAVLIFGFIVGITSEDVEEDTQKEAQSKEKSSTNNKEQKDNNDKNTEKKESKPKNETFKKKYKDELVFAEYKVDRIETEIKNKSLKLSFTFTNQSGRDDIPFTAVGFLDVIQDDKPLDETSDAYNPMNNNYILEKIKTGHTIRISTEYKIKNDKPIEIRFGATNEYDNTKESITIKDWK